MLRLSFVLVVLTVVLYPFMVWSIAQFTPNQGNLVRTEVGDKVYFAQIGQRFDTLNYFSSRPSAVSYQAAVSGGSNKGPSNPDYLATVEKRVVAFRSQNPEVSQQLIPADLVTASGSGLDPHISVEAARIQVPRIARERKLDPIRLYALIDAHQEFPFLGFLGPKKIHVLQLNLALDALTQQL